LTTVLLDGSRGLVGLSLAGSGGRALISFLDPVNPFGKALEFCQDELIETLAQERNPRRRFFPGRS
jgi:hypothetical protein